jgi:hypothetical protein
VTIKEIAQKLGLGLRRVQRWVRLIELPARNVMAPKPSTPAYYGAYLARRWAEGVTAVKSLLAEICQRGYAGSHSHLARFLAPWRKAIPSTAMVSASSYAPAENEAAIPPPMATLGPDDRPQDLLTHRCGALCQTTRRDDAPADRQC